MKVLNSDGLTVPIRLILGTGQSCKYCYNTIIDQIGSQIYVDRGPVVTTELLNSTQINLVI